MMLMFIFLYMKSFFLLEKLLRGHLRKKKVLLNIFLNGKSDPFTFRALN